MNGGNVNATLVSNLEKGRMKQEDTKYNTQTKDTETSRTEKWEEESDADFVWTLNLAIEKKWTFP